MNRGRPQRHGAPARALLNAADLFALASRSEGWCNAIAEALACGCPVVATDVGGVPEVIEHGVDGYLVPARDVAAAARFGVEILSRADRGREMGIRGRANAERKYSSRDVIPHYEAYYRQVLGGAAAARA